MLSVATKALRLPFQRYNEMLDRFPLATKCVTSGVMYAGGDVIAQYTETYNFNRARLTPEEPEKSTVIDKKRTLVFFIFGTTIAGVAYNYWFNYLNELPALLWRLKQTRHRGKIARSYAYLKSHGIEVKLDLTKLPNAAPLTKWKSKAAKILADQLIFSSSYTLVFFMAIGMLNGVVDRAERYVRRWTEPDEEVVEKVPLTQSSASPPVTGPDESLTLLIDRLSRVIQEQERKLFSGVDDQDGQHVHSDETESTTSSLSVASTTRQTQSSSQNLTSSTENVLAEDGAQRMRVGEHYHEGDDQVAMLQRILHELRTQNSLAKREQELAERLLAEDIALSSSSSQRQLVDVANGLPTWSQLWDSSWQHCKTVYWETYIADCLVWPPLQLINFSFVPVQFQFLYVNVANLAWNTFLSLMANQKHGHGSDSRAHSSVKDKDSRSDTQSNEQHNASASVTSS